MDNIFSDEKHREYIDTVLEEACRQWCDFIDEAGEKERRTGKGFADFCREIAEEMSFSLLPELI